MNAQQFITETGITLDYIPATSNPLMDKDMFHYNCTLSVGKRSISMSYSKGGGCLQRKAKTKFMPFSDVTAKDLDKAKNTRCYYDFNLKQFRPYHGPSTTFMDQALAMVWEPKPPTIEEVLECLSMDALVLDAPTFADWATDLGYDADSIKAKAIYDTCIQQTLAFRGLIGNNRLEQLREIEF